MTINYEIIFNLVCIFGALIKDKLRIRGGKAKRKKEKKTLSNIRRNVILGKVFDKIRLYVYARLH